MTHVRVAGSVTVHNPHINVARIFGVALKTCRTQTIAPQIRTEMSDISDDQLSEVYAFAVQLGKDAGEMLMKAARTRFETQSGPSTTVSYVEKDNSVDIVTKTDNGKFPPQYRRPSSSDRGQMSRRSSTSPSQPSFPLTSTYLDCLPMTNLA